ncbi:MAG: hypothetical protein ACE15F_23315, partial [bacterium]
HPHPDPLPEGEGIASLGEESKRKRVNSFCGGFRYIILRDPFSRNQTDGDEYPSPIAAQDPGVDRDHAADFPAV